VMSSQSLPVAKLRHAASSIAPVITITDAPCVLAWLAFRLAGTGQHHLKGH
jgi:hypothetical protein